MSKYLIFVLLSSFIFIFPTFKIIQSMQLTNFKSFKDKCDNSFKYLGSIMFFLLINTIYVLMLIYGTIAFSESVIVSSGLALIILTIFQKRLITFFYSKIAHIFELYSLTKEAKWNFIFNYLGLSVLAFSQGNTFCGCFLLGFTLSQFSWFDSNDSIFLEEVFSLKTLLKKCFYSYAFIIGLFICCNNAFLFCIFIISPLICFFMILIYYIFKQKSKMI